MYRIEIDVYRLPDGIKCHTESCKYRDDPDMALYKATIAVKASARTRIRPGKRIIDHYGSSENFWEAMRSSIATESSNRILTWIHNGYLQTQQDTGTAQLPLEGYDYISIRGLRVYIR